MRGSRDAILYNAHFDSPAVRREVARLHDEVGKDYDIFVVGFCQTPDALSGIKEVPARPYCLSDLLALPYRTKLASFNPLDTTGNNDLSLLRFCLDHPDYERYWVIEYDVRLSGHWFDLFADLAASPADLLGTTVMRYAEHPSWAHWGDLITAAETIPRKRLIKGFLPFCRLSRAAVEAIDRRYRAGWGGHQEVVWPTIIGREGMKLEDVGGYGRFTPARRRGRYYESSPTHWSQFPGTFAFRPIYSDANRFGPGDAYGNNTLWHPVKE
jgi:hypothetical protein